MHPTSRMAMKTAPRRRALRLGVVGISLFAVAGGVTAGCGGGKNAIKGDPPAGKKVFLLYPCGQCHALKATGSVGSRGPDLDRVLKGRDADFIRESIVDPTAYVEKGYSAYGMPTVYGNALTKKQLADLVAFLVNATR